MSELNCKHVSTSFLICSVFYLKEAALFFVQMVPGSLVPDLRTIHTLDSIHLYIHYDKFLANERKMFCANKNEVL